MVIHENAVDKYEFLHRKKMQHKMNIVICRKIKDFQGRMWKKKKKTPMFCG